MLFCLYLWPKRKSGHKIKQKNQGSLIYSTDQKTRLVRYLLSLGLSRGEVFNWNKLLNLAGFAVKCDLQNWPNIAHVLTERSHNEFSLLQC